jgi:hypothetical protein
VTIRSPIGPTSSRGRRQPRPFASSPEPLERRRLLTADPIVGLRSELVATEIDAAGNAADAAVVGELATHRLTLEIPGGSLRESVLHEALGDALAYVEFVGAEISSPLVSVSGSLTPVLAADGRSLSFDLGIIVNEDLDPTTAETITFTYRSIVRNVAAARAAVPAATAARFTAAGLVDPVLALSSPLRLLEPKLDVTAVVRIAGGAAAELLRLVVSQLEVDDAAPPAAWSRSGGASHAAAPVTQHM